MKPQNYDIVVRYILEKKISLTTQRLVCSVNSMKCSDCELCAMNTGNDESCITVRTEVLQYIIDNHQLPQIFL